MVKVLTAACPNCGAPLTLHEGHHHVICIFCNTSVLVQRGAAVAPGAGAGSDVKLTAENVSKEDIERLKQLVLDGKRDEAVGHYMRAAGVTQPEAEKAVNDMMLSDYWRLTSQLPINAFGFVLYGGLMSIGLAVAAYGVSHALAGESAAYWLGLLGVPFAIWRFVRFVPHVFSTWVRSFGAEGHARVLKCAVLRTHPPNGGTIVQVAFEVRPLRGGASFLDEETLFLQEASVPKVAPGNVIPVRYDEPGRTRVFPTSPITVIATTSGPRA